MTPVEPGSRERPAMNLPKPHSLRLAGLFYWPEAAIVQRTFNTMSEENKIDLSAPEVQAAIEAATAPLLAKNKELLGELKKAKKGTEIDPQTVSDLEAQVEELQGKLNQAQKDLKTAATNAEKATKALSDEQSFTQRLLIDKGLLEDLGKNGVTDPAYQKAAVAMLRSGVQIVVDGENRIAKVGDKLLSDHVAEWAKSDEGKRFAAAPANNGGGSQGGGGNAANKDLSKLPPAERMTAARAGKT